MIGTGTLINVGAIILGGIIGLVCKKIFNQKLQEIVIQATGLATIFIGIGGALSKMLIIENGTITGNGTMMLLFSLIIGSVIGEVLGIEATIESLGAWLREKSHSSGEESFMKGFMTASLTVCIGAMAVVGAMEDGLRQDPSLLIAKSVLDFMIVMIMASSLGKGCVFSAVPVGIFQGSITILAIFVEPFMTEVAIHNLSLVGSMLIFCVGINILWPNKFRVANMLPALLVAVLFPQG